MKVVYVLFIHSAHKCTRVAVLLCNESCIQSFVHESALKIHSASFTAAAFPLQFDAK